MARWRIIEKDNVYGVLEVLSIMCCDFRLFPDFLDYPAYQSSTAKYLIGITLQGTVSFISEGG